ncbi:MAG TPA: hypothetical protein VLG49_00365 [Rhabdochlamydiaceae bacterium]|nr:hypothetical protein [Rhabdochlamydiaceae bacterium]
MKLVLFFIASCIGIMDFSFATDSYQEFSLLHKHWKLHSQNGEEGVLEEILNRMKIHHGFFVEFGACDGVLFSNTRFLVERGWSGAFIECDEAYIPQLQSTCDQLPNVKCIQEFVTSNPSDNRGKMLDVITQQNFPDQEIDVLSIDIDGGDYLILESLDCKPKVICIESSGYWHPSFQTRVPDEVAQQNLGQPLSIIIDIAKNKGYEPVCFLVVNLILVRNDYYHLFSEIKNDPMTLWLDSWNYMGLNQPYDQQYIWITRATNPLLIQYDTYSTPPLAVPLEEVGLNFQNTSAKMFYKYKKVRKIHRSKK